MAPRTIYELLELLESYHQRRHDSYLQLAAAPVQDLATRLRDLERTKDREIAKFTRID